MVRATMLAAALAFAIPAHADVPTEPPEHGDVKEHGEHGDHAATHEAAEHEGEPEGIVNWWSWDYGDKTTDPSHKGWPPPFGWALVNFVVFLGLLSKILWKPLKSGWVAKHEQIKSELGEAKRLRAEAEAQLAEYTKKVANADSEVDALLAQLRKEADADRARIVAAAEGEAARLKTEAERQIKVEIERARQILQIEAVNAAVGAARDILEKNINAEDQKRLGERYLSDVEKLDTGRGGVA
jgi:F-type H+-transporting ATPase subunit b